MTSRHYPVLDGVRGLAILLVLVWHYLSVPAPPGSWLAYAQVPLRLTYTGVDFFFVLSGFLIGGILIDSRGRSRYFATFYGRRARRILPLYIAALAAFAFIVYLHRAGVPGLAFAANEPLPWWAYAGIQNLAMMKYGTELNGISVSWSLAVEEQVYVLLPLLVRLTAPGWLARVVVAMIAVALLSRFVVGDWRAYVFTVSRLDAIGLGMLAAIAIRNREVWTRLTSPRVLRVAWVSLLAGALLLTLRVIPMFPFGYTMLAALYTVAMITALSSPDSRFGRVLSAPWLRSLGTISYGVYLFHMPILYLAHGLILGRDTEYPGLADLPSVGATGLALILTLLLASLSWRYFERPLLTAGRRPRPADPRSEVSALAGQ